MFRTHFMLPVLFAIALVAGSGASLAQSVAGKSFVQKFKYKITVCEFATCRSTGNIITSTNRIYVATDGKRIFGFVSEDSGEFHVSGKKDKDGVVITVAGNKIIATVENREFKIVNTTTYLGGKKCNYDQKTVWKVGSYRSKYTYYGPIICEVHDGNIFAR